MLWTLRLKPSCLIRFSFVTGVKVVPARTCGEEAVSNLALQSYFLEWNIRKVSKRMGTWQLPRNCINVFHCAARSSVVLVAAFTALWLVSTSSASSATRCASADAADARDSGSPCSQSKERSQWNSGKHGDRAVFACVSVKYAKPNQS